MIFLRDSEYQTPEPTTDSLPAPSARSSIPSGGANVPSELLGVINDAASHYELPPSLLTGLLYQESRFNPRAVSPAGAKGIAQFMDGTAKEMGVADPFDTGQAIFGAAEYLRRQIDRFDGDVLKGLAAYNAGPGRVAAAVKNGDDWNKVLPPETRDYIMKVPMHADRYRNVFAEAMQAEPVAEEPIAAPVAEEEKPGLLGGLNNLRKSMQQETTDNLDGAVDGGTTSPILQPLSTTEKEKIKSYERLFRENNPGASDAATKHALGEFEKKLREAPEKAINSVTQRFDLLQSPDAMFQNRLDKKLAGSSQGIVPSLPDSQSGDVLVSNLNDAQEQQKRMSMGVGEQAMMDLKRGTKNLQAIGYGAAALGADLVGAEKMADDLLAGYLKRTEEAKDFAPVVGTHKNIESLGDFGRYAVEAIMENAPMFLPSLLSGGVGAIAARKVAERGVASAVDGMVAKGVSLEVAKRAVAGAVAKRVTAGAAAGAAPSSIGMISGGIYGDVFEETGEKRAGLSLAYGVPAGLLDTIPMVMALRKAVGPVADQFAGHVIKRLGTEAGKQFFAEGGTELVQTFMEEAAKADASKRPLLTAELADMLIDAALKGGLAGSALGAGSQAISEARRAYDPMGLRQLDRDINAATFNPDSINATAVESLRTSNQIAPELTRKPTATQVAASGGSMADVANAEITPVVVPPPVAPVAPAPTQQAAAGTLVEAGQVDQNDIFNQIIGATNAAEPVQVVETLSQANGTQAGIEQAAAPAREIDAGVPNQGATQTQQATQAANVPGAVPMQTPAQPATTAALTQTPPALNIPPAIQQRVATKTDAELNVMAKANPDPVVQEAVKQEQATRQQIPQQQQQQQAKARNIIDTAKDSALVAIAKLGGMDTQQLLANGFDQNDISVQKGARVSKKTGQLGKAPVRAKSVGFNLPIHRNGGMSLDGMREALVQRGYLPEDASVNDAIDLLNRELRGEPVYTQDAIESQAAEAEAARMALLEASDVADDQMDFEAESNAELRAINAAYDALSEDNQAFIRGMRKYGASDEEINGYIAEFERVREGAVDGAEASQAGSVESRGQESDFDGEALGGKESAEPDWLSDDSFALAGQTEAEVRAHEAERKAEEERTKREAAEAELARKDAELQAEIKRRSETAADTFELGQDGMDNLTGQGGLRFSKVSDAPAGEELVAIHNLSAENLLYADEIGGIPVPSIGITKAASPFSGFGEITLIASNDMIDPERSVPVFDRDAYTARFPKMNYKKVQSKKADAFYERMKPVIQYGEDGKSFMQQLLDAMTDSSASPNKVSEAFQRYLAPRMMYAKEALGKDIRVPMKPIEPEHPFTFEKTWIDFVKANKKDHNDDAFNKRAGLAARKAMSEYVESKMIDGEASNEKLRKTFAGYLNRYVGEDGSMNWNVLDKAYEQAGMKGKKRVDSYELSKRVDKVVGRNDPAYLKWITAQTEGLFNEPTITLRGREVAPTLDNIVDAMTTGGIQGAEKTMTFGGGKTAAMLGKRFQSIDEIKAARDQIVSSGRHDEMKKDSEKTVEAYRLKAVEFFTGKDWRGNIDTWAGMDSAMEALAKAGKMSLTDGQIKAALSSKGFRGVSQEVVDLARESIVAIRSAATDYFEAKPQRAVSLKEFKGAVVPKGTDLEVIAALERNGLTVVEYNSKNHEDRAVKVGKLAKTLNRTHKNVLFSFAGQSSDTADTHALAAAQDRLNAGEDADTVRKETGWFRGAESTPAFFGRGVWPKVIKGLSIPKGTVNSVGAYAKLLSDLLESKTFQTQGFGGFDVPTQRLVMSVVVSTIHDLKIRNRVVELIPVNVMDNLVAQQTTPDMLFNNMAMLQDLLAVDSDASISVGVDVAGLIAKAVASVATENSSALLRAGFGEKTIPAVATDQRGRFFVLPRADVGAEKVATFTAPDGSWRDVEGDVTLTTLDSRHNDTPENVFDSGILTQNIKEVFSRPDQRTIWKFEISDRDAFLKGTGTFEETVMARYAALNKQAEPITVGDVLWHPSLFAAYPGIADIEVQFTPKGESSKGQYSDGVIRIRGSLDKKEALSVLLHEIQHGIQNIEGFASGGSESNIAPDIDALNELNKLSFDEMDSFQREMYKDLRSRYGRSKTARDAYRRLAGEVEARNTQARMNMTDAERRATPPSQTADVADSDVIVVFNGKEMQSAPAPANAQPSTKAPTLTESDLLPQMAKAMGSETLAKVLLDSGLVTGVRGEDALKRLVARKAGAKFMVAWHGSPHDHDKFDSSKIGTGEGAQAYGHGLYFAGRKEVAEWYKNQLTTAGGREFVHGNIMKLVDYSGGANRLKSPSAIKEFFKTEADDKTSYIDGISDRDVTGIGTALYALSNNDGFANELSSVNGDLASVIERRDAAKSSVDGGDKSLFNEYLLLRKEAGEISKKAYEILSDAIYKAIPKGRLYQVDLAPSEDEYLDWDKPLSEQSEKVKDALAELDIEVGGPRLSAGDGIVYDFDVVHGSAIYSYIGKLKGGDNGASEYLHSIGIRGIKYLDGSSRGAGDGSRNYVIFNDADVSITEKYSEENQIQGVTLPDGRIILNLDALTADNFAGVFKHEGFHSTVRELLGEAKYNQLMKQLDGQLKLAKGNTWVDQARAAVPANTKPEHVTEEIGAYAIEQVENGAKVPNFIKRWAESFMSALRTAIIRFANADGKLQAWAMNNLKPEDLSNLAIAGLRAKARGAMQGQMREAMAYSVANLPDTRYSRVSGNQQNGFDLPKFTTMDKWQERIQDRYNRFRDVLKYVRDQGGVVNDLNDFSMGEDRFHGVAMERVIGVQEKLQAILSEAKANDVTMDEVMMFGYAEHAPDRNRAMQAMNPNVQTGSGMSDQDAADIIAAADAEGNRATLEGLTEKVRDIARETLELQVRSGLTTRAEADAYRAKYGDKWLPLRGFETINENGRTFRGTGQGFNIRGKENLRALGRDSKAGQILENVLLDAERTAIRATKNEEVNLRFLKFVIDNPDQNLWEIDKVKTTRGMRDGMVKEDMIIDKGDGTIGIKVNGEVVYIKVHDDKLFEQLANQWNDVEWNGIPYLQDFSRYLSRSYTAWSPEFALYTNPVRDVQAALFSITGREGIGMTGGFVKAYPKAVKMAYNSEVRGKDDPLYAEYKKMGGKTGFWNHNTLETKVKEIEALVKDMEATPTGNPFRYSWKMMKALEAVVSNHAGALENATRFASYIAMREAGRSREESAAFAKNLNVNFNRRGTWTAGIGSIVLFFNPAIQGVHNQYETLLKGKHKYQAWALMAAHAAAMGGLAMLAASSGEDDDGVKWWDKIPDYEKERNIIIMLPSYMKDYGHGIEDSTGRYLKIPMPYQWNVGGYLGTLAADVYRNKENPTEGTSAPKAALLLGKSVVTSYVPGGIPPTIAPIVHHAFNDAPFGDGQLYPENSWNKHKPDSEKYTARQKDTPWQHWASFVNEATGGNEFESGYVSIAPAAWKNYVRSYVGGPASFVEGIYDAAIEEDITKAPFLRKMYGEVDMRRDAGKFYDTTEKPISKLKAYKDADKAGSEYANEIAKTHGVLLDLGEMALDYQKYIGKITKDDIAIKDDKSLNGEMKKMKLRKNEKERSDIQEQYLKEQRRIISEAALKK